MYMKCLLQFANYKVDSDIDTNNSYHTGTRHCSTCISNSCLIHLLRCDTRGLYVLYKYTQLSSVFTSQTHNTEPQTGILGFI